MEILREYNGIQIPQREDGFISATAMTKSHFAATQQRKEVSEWLSSQRVQESIKHLSLLTEISVNDLVQARPGVGTYIHPKLATRFGIWLSDDFGYQVEMWTEELMTKGSVSITPIPVDEFTVDIGRANALTSYLASLGVHKALAATKLLQIVGEKHNALILTDSAKALVGEANAEVDKFYTATEIGALLTPPLSSRKINPLLASKGLLGKNSKNEWEVTEYGKQFSVLIPYTASNKHSSFQIKWKATVIPILNSLDDDNDLE